MFRGLWLLVFAIAFSPAFADEAEHKAYSESFRKGATRVTEQSFDVTLTPDTPRPEYKVADSKGTARYLLRFVPDVSRGDTKVIGWFVRLADLHHKIYDNVLPTSQDMSKDTTQLWWLDGRQYSKIPLQTTRIFRVEQFYCTVRVKNVARLFPGQPYLKELDLAVQFGNEKP